MTQSLSNVAVQQFRDSFTNVYQGTQVLRETAITIRDVVGDAYKFKLAGKAVMNKRGAFQSLIEASDINYSAPTANLEGWALNLPTDIFQQAQVNANERQNLAKVHAAALGRREDQTVIDALDASGTTKTVAAGATNLTLEKLIDASKELNLDAVPNSTRYIAIHPNNLASLLQETEVTSSDFNSIRALVNGEINTFMGFKFFMIEDRTEGGLPISANIRTCFAWHHDSMGMAFNLNPSIAVEWSPERQSWLSISRLSLGATALDTNGIVEVLCDES